MAVGYKIASGTDLDGLFMARSSAAAANVGFKDSSGVDLSNRYEPRGVTTAIANTNYRNSSGTDLAQIFKDINAATAIITRTMVAGNLGASSFNEGFRNTTSGYSAYPGQSISAAPEWTKNSTLYRLDEFRDDGGTPNEFLFRVSNLSATPANADTTWSFMRLTGTFENGTGTRTWTRAEAYVTNTYTNPNGNPGRLWQINKAGHELVTGNSYTLEIG